MTIEKIIPQTNISYADENLQTMEFDKYLEHNITSLTGTLNKTNKVDKESKTEIVNNEAKLESNNLVKPALSINNVTDCATNTNNDFDQNTIIQPDNIHLIKQNKSRNLQTKSTAQFYTSEMDLIETIGGKWQGTTEPEQLEKFSQFEVPEKYNKAESKTEKMLKNNSFTYIINGSKTLPKKKLNEDRVANFTTYTGM